MDMNCPSPLTYGFSFSTKGYVVIAPQIVILLYPSSPTAILRTVRAVVVYAVKRMIGGRVAHIREEILKRVPTFANRDAASAIIHVAFFAGIVAPLPHPSPSAMGPSVGESMRNAPVGSRIEISHDLNLQRQVRLWSDPLRKLELLRGSLCIIA